MTSFASQPCAATTFVTRRGADLAADIEPIMAVYAAATGTVRSDLPVRRDIFRRHTTYPDAVGSLAFCGEGATAALAGFCYGAAGEPGQWWHDRVRSAMDDIQRARWLADPFVICELAVVPEEQGRGLGRELVRRILALSEARKHRTVLLSAETDNTVDSLYRSLGFEEILDDLRFAPAGPTYRIMGREPDGA